MVDIERLFFSATILLSLTLVLVGFIGCGNDNSVVSLSPASTPDVVLQAADDAVPGGEIMGIEREEEDGEYIYEVQKLVDGVNYEIEITAEGDVLEIEQGDDDDEEDDDD